MSPSEARRQRWLPALPMIAYPPLGLMALGLGCGALAGLGLPQGLASLLGLQWLGWYGINLLHQPLARCCHPSDCISSNPDCCGRPTWWALPCC